MWWNGNPSTTPRRIVDNNSKFGYFYGFYLQDEWKPFEQLTINAGGRFDVVNAFDNENQLSPRLNIVYEPFTGTAFHAGYARYFTPPPLENVCKARSRSLPARLTSPPLPKIHRLRPSGRTTSTPVLLKRSAKTGTSGGRLL